MATLLATTINGALTVGNSTSSDIYMVDTDENTRRQHCNSSRIGFLSTSNSWGSYCATDGSWRSEQAMYAPIFYDLDNSAYYCNPASTSNLVAITTGATGTYNTFNSWTDLNGYHGFYSSVYNGSHFYVNNGSYGSWRIAGSRNGWGGLEFDRTHQVCLMINHNEVGFYNVSYGWQINWYQGTLYTSTGTYGGSMATVLHSSNYNSYSPTLTGGGASGTWGINITGNAGNTSSISNAVGSGYTWGGQQYFQSNLGGYCGSLSGPPLQAYSTSNNSAFMSFHKGGYYAVNMGLDADNVLRIGGWSASANRWELDMSGNCWVAGSFRAPIFYDSANTAYYLDPSSTTSLRTVGSWRSDSSSWDGEFSGKIQYHSNHWYIQGADLFIYRNAGGSNVFTVTQGGNGSFSGSVTTGGQIYINNGDPTIFLQDSNHRSSMIHCNSNIFYILRGSGTNSTSWSTYNGYWPLEINLDNNNATFGGNVTAVYDVTAYSDARVKENVITIEDALDKVLNLRGVYYNRTDSEDKRRKVGVIAQEILEVIPEVVGQDNVGMYNVSYGNIVGVLIEAIKEQQKQIDELKARLN